MRAPLGGEGLLEAGVMSDEKFGGSSGLPQEAFGAEVQMFSDDSLGDLAGEIAGLIDQVISRKWFRISKDPDAGFVSCDSDGVGE